MILQKMSRAIVLQHVEHAGPGRIGPVFRDFGIPVEIRKLWKGDEVPTDLDEVRVLVVLDGPMSIKEVIEPTTRFPFLGNEVQTMQRIIAADRALLAIGFGAQLLAHAAGAKVHPNTKPGPTPDSPGTPAPEFGWGPVTFPFPGGTEPIVYGLTDGSLMFHWHTDTFDLPKLPAPSIPAPPPAPPPPTGNALLSSSGVCKHQAFRFKTRLFGFQYHFEFTQDDIEKMVSAERDRASNAMGSDVKTKVLQETPEHYSRYARQGDRILQNFVQFLKAY
jgi:GMP synthase (glutamine-hydrolysing)